MSKNSPFAVTKNKPFIENAGPDRWRRWIEYDIADVVIGQISMAVSKFESPISSMLSSGRRVGAHGSNCLYLFVTGNCWLGALSTSVFGIKILI